jgi:hypothetical protein
MKTYKKVHCLTFLDVNEFDKITKKNCAKFEKWKKNKLLEENHN